MANQKPIEETKPTRRDFCAQALTFVTVASLLEGCGSNSNPNNPGGGGGGANVPQLTRINATNAGGTVTVQNIGASALGTVNSAALVQSGAGSILVVHTGQDTFNAFTAICTHEQCEITGFNSGTFVCPCHGSQYNTGGSVVQGPATQRLRQFTTSFTNNVLTITT